MPGSTSRWSGACTSCPRPRPVAGPTSCERLDLTEAADRLVKTFWRQRRRLDLAASLVAAPEVLFLDEPTTGLDPARGDLWDLLRELVRDGTTVILTTQYLEEADRLADDIIVLDHGRTVAHGTPAELKARIGEDRLEVRFAEVADLAPRPPCSPIVDDRADGRPRPGDRHRVRRGRTADRPDPTPGPTPPGSAWTAPTTTRHSTASNSS